MIKHTAGCSTFERPIGVAVSWHGPLSRARRILKPGVLLEVLRALAIDQAEQLLHVVAIGWCQPQLVVSWCFPDGFSVVSQD